MPTKSKPKVFGIKQSQIIFAIIQFFKPKNVLLLSEEEQNTTEWISLFSKETVVRVEKNIQHLLLKPLKFDMIILSKSLSISEKEIVNILLPLISNDSVVIIPHIHASKPTINLWKRFVKEDYISISSDLFFVGILFFREESIKQDFQLRL